MQWCDLHPPPLWPELAWILDCWYDLRPGFGGGTPPSEFAAWCDIHDIDRAGRRSLWKLLRALDRTYAKHQESQRDKDPMPPIGKGRRPVNRGED